MYYRVAIQADSSAREGGTSMERESVAVMCQQSVHERGWGGGELASRGMSAREKRRQE
jgi:hypothetical protein